MGGDDAKTIYKDRAATAECANAQARNQYAQDRRGARAPRPTCRTMLWVRACHSAMVLTLSMLRTRNCVSPRYVLGPLTDRPAVVELTAATTTTKTVLS
jgi:hypothetical protein